MEENAIIDLGKIGLTFDPNPWNAAKAYEKYTVIMHNGRGWVSLVDNKGHEPSETDPMWMIISDSGESLYQMMVRTGRFVGTEDEFLQQYQDALSAAVNAAAEARAAATDVQAKGEAALAAASAAEQAAAAAGSAADDAINAKNTALAAAGQAEGSAAAAREAATDAGAAADLAREKATQAGAAATSANEEAAAAHQAVVETEAATGAANAAAGAANAAAASVTNHTLGIDFDPTTGLLQGVYGSHGSILDVEMDQETGQIVVTEQID